MGIIIEVVSTKALKFCSLQLTLPMKVHYSLAVLSLVPLNAKAMEYNLWRKTTSNRYVLQARGRASTKCKFRHLGGTAGSACSCQR